MEVALNPYAESSPFKVTYARTISIEYPNGGDLRDALSGKQWTMSNAAGFEDPGVQNLVQRLNSKILYDGSHARVVDLDVDYRYDLYGGESAASINYRLVLEGELSNYVITRNDERTLVDLGWRGMTVHGEVTVDGAEINLPGSILRAQEPDAYAILGGTEADKILNHPLIELDLIHGLPLTNWHFLLDPPRNSLSRHDCV